jgi:uncharacterized membrane protein YphA (DoxX/SURF4 family)
MSKRIILVLRLLLGAIFVYAAYTKLRHPWLVFAMSIDAYGLLPEWAVLLVARALPWTELVLGLMLLSGVWVKYASAALALLIGIFFLIMVLAWGKGMGIDCGCFGLGDALGVKSLMRDGAMAAAAVALTILSFRRSADNLEQGSTHGEA